MQSAHQFVISASESGARTKNGHSSAEIGGVRPFVTPHRRSKRMLSARVCLMRHRRRVCALRWSSAKWASKRLTASAAAPINCASDLTIAHQRPDGSRRLPTSVSP